jgi:predicted ArsR family transcriptional regulator
MDAERLLVPENGTPLGRSRSGVLDLLHAADRPLGVREVAQRMELHPNTARFHLEALVEAGLAVREAEERQAPGRPRIGYRAAAEGPAGRRRYRLLAQMLASLIAGTMPEPGRAAEEAGRAWGAYLTEQPPPFQRLRAADAIADLARTMEELGFSPQVEAGADGGQYELRLRQCPFREVAQQHREVICGLHLGLIRGAFDLMRAPVTADGLGQFGGVTAAELAEPGGVVGVPSSQFRGRRDVLGPFVEPGGVLAQSAWPHPVDKHAGAVVRGRVVVDAANPDARVRHEASFPGSPGSRGSPGRAAVGGAAAGPSCRPARAPLEW